MSKPGLPVPDVQYEASMSESEIAALFGVTRDEVRALYYRFVGALAAAESASLPSDMRALTELLVVDPDADEFDLSAFGAVFVAALAGALSFEGDVIGFVDDVQLRVARQIVLQASGGGKA